jgi:uncharacterized protein
MNRVIHFEIHASEPEKLATWYKNIFRWEMKKFANPMMEYWIIMTAPEDSKEPGINGGILKRRGPAPKEGNFVSSFVCTIHVPSVDEYMDKVVSSGGKTALSKMAIPGLAWLAYCIDIDGNIFGIYEDDKNAK